MKYSKDVLNAVNRLPTVAKMTAFRAIDWAVRDAVNTTADAFIQASILVLIDEFGFGTRGENATKIQRFVSALQEVIDMSADQYDDAVANGLNNRLHERGIEYNMRGRKND